MVTAYHRGGREQRRKGHHDRSLQGGYLENHNRAAGMFQKGMQGEQKTVAMMMVCPNQWEGETRLGSEE